MIEITSAEFEKEVLKGGKVVLDFYSTNVLLVRHLPQNLNPFLKYMVEEIKFLKIFRQKNRELADKLELNRLQPFVF